MFAKFTIFTKFSISVKIATFKGNLFAIAFEFLLRILANVRHIRHLRQIGHIRQDRHSQRATLLSHFNFFLDFGTFKGDPFAILFELLLKLWRILTIFAIFGKILTFKGPLCHLIWIFPKTGGCSQYLSFSPKSALSKWSLCHVIGTFAKLWRECAIFAIFTKFALFVKIATFKLPLCHLIWNFAKTLVNVRHIRQIYHLAKIATLRGNPSLPHMNIRQTLAEFSPFSPTREFPDMSPEKISSNLHCLWYSLLWRR